jgi:hypothetical protein
MMKDSVRNEIEDEDFQICTTLYWTRSFFDSYLLRNRSKESKLPMVIETRDFIVSLPTSAVQSCGVLTTSYHLTQYKTCLVVDHICRETGVPRDGVQFHWVPTPEEQQPPSAL